ncbi:tlde1 domain-containing protein [Methylocella sp.]|jgi:hypothetical protein|uniref:DUF2778 domain-containing protein n=1 Tax=Methylocella sp. TaxID=1978226 RepID=UPI003C28C1B2
MTYGFDTPIDFIPLDRGRLSRRNPFFSQIAPGAVILALGALFGYWTLYVRPAPAPKLARAPTVAAPLWVASNPYGALAHPRSASSSTPASSSSGSTSALLAQPFPLEASLESNPPEPSAAGAEPESTAPDSAESAPLPVPRPADLAPPASRSPLQESGRRLAQQNARTAPAADNRSFFDKVFAMVQPSTAPAPSAPSRQVLAYAAPDDGAVSPVQRLTAPPPAARADRGTAIYDVSAHTVYMPDGTRLEAHSGLGQLKDDPRYVSERMRGPTPPAVYDLQPREQLFHGVKALRLTPVGGGGVYGRTGLLAHRYMLGPNGDSNGCVSFRDYNAFLQAYERGQVQRLVVVARSN